MPTNIFVSVNIGLKMCCIGDMGGFANDVPVPEFGIGMCDAAFELW